MTTIGTMVFLPFDRFPGPQEAQDAVRAAMDRHGIEEADVETLNADGLMRRLFGDGPDYRGIRAGDRLIVDFIPNGSMRGMPVALIVKSAADPDAVAVGHVASEEMANAALAQFEQRLREIEESR